MRVTKEERAALCYNHIFWDITSHCIRYRQHWGPGSEMEALFAGVPASLDRQMKTTCQSHDTQEPSQASKAESIVLRK